MIIHFLKVAIRNHLAHKTQTLISLFGLAMAFACVSLASFWNYYERTYDSFQENADRIYRVRQRSKNSEEAFGHSQVRLHRYLKEKYPEIEAAGYIRERWNHNSYESLHENKDGGVIASINGITYPQKVYVQGLSQDALDSFSFEWIEGNKKLMTYKGGEVAISEQLARSMCGNKSPLGQMLNLEGRELEIAGVYKTWPRHSNLKFDIIESDTPFERELNSWGGFGVHTYIMLKSGVDHQKFIQKVQSDTIKDIPIPVVYDLITPLKELRYTSPDDGTNIRLKDVNLFSNASILLTLCALLNYLILFISRLHARGRDMALRTICGSSSWQLIGLLLTEYLLLLLMGLLVGMLFVELAMNQFMKLAMIRIEFSSVMISCGYLMLASLILSVVLSIFPILYFKRKTLRVQIEAEPTRLGNNYFRSTGVCVQLIIGFLFIFCTTIMMKQVYMLTHTDHIERKQVAWVRASMQESDILLSTLQQQPFIKEILPDVNPLYPNYHMTNNRICDWEGKSTGSQDIYFANYTINDEIASFYGLQMKEGPASFELGKGEVFINETMAKEMNISNPIGKTVAIKHSKSSPKIKGIIYDFHIQNPKTSPIPILYSRHSDRFYTIGDKTFKQFAGSVPFKYNGNWTTCKKILEKELQQKGVKYPSFADTEEHYQYFLKSEYNLLQLLSIITIVSILIAIFGIYALIMQSCDQHQKEIAIRKVFGAKVLDILLMFFKQYMAQMALAAIIAFPIGYFLMKNWLEQYTRQTSISIWIYAGIFLGVSILVTLSIGWRIWKAANENPAQIIKKE